VLTDLPGFCPEIVSFFSVFLRNIKSSDLVSLSIIQSSGEIKERWVQKGTKYTWPHSRREDWQRHTGFSHI